MSKALYFDLSCGASGDMILAAAMDLGVPVKGIIEPLLSLELPGFEIETTTVLRNGIACNQCQVRIQHEHVHRGLKDIVGLIEKSSVPGAAKANSVKVFQRIAEAEAKVHQKEMEEVHFHEVGAADSIIDIVGGCTAFALLGVEEFYAGELTVGTGTLTCQHGTMPVPSPATAELVQGFRVRVLDTKTEILTPTGAGMITALAQQSLPAGFVSDRIGTGTGQKEISGFSGHLRLWLGEIQVTRESDTVVAMEANLDDCTGEILGHAMEKLFEAGALDVFFQPIAMKKNRPGSLLTVLCPPALREKIADVVFRETTTIGIRFQEMSRLKLARKSIDLKSPWGPLRAKEIGAGPDRRIAPEYEECRKMAEANSLPLRTVCDWVTKQNG